MESEGKSGDSQEQGKKCCHKYGCGCGFKIIGAVVLILLGWICGFLMGSRCGFMGHRGYGHNGSMCGSAMAGCPTMSSSEDKQVPQSSQKK